MLLFDTVQGAIMFAFRLITAILFPIVIAAFIYIPFEPSLILLSADPVLASASR